MILSQLELGFTTASTPPLPDDYVEVQASWSLVGYQWNVWQDVLETIDYTNGGKDPKDDEYYSYYLNRDICQCLC